MLLRSRLNFLNYGRTLCYSSLNTKLLMQQSVSNFDEILDQIHDIERNLSARRRTLGIDLHALKKLHSMYRKMAAYKRCFKKPEDRNSYELRQFESLDVLLKNFKTLVFGYLLALPNGISERTPCGDEDTVILTKRISDSLIDAENHISVGRKLQVLRYEDKATYYLMNDAAILELAVVRFLRNVLQNERCFKPFSNPDTCNSFVLEGVEVDELPKHALHLLDSHQVLVGGASLASFCAARVGTSTHTKFMPENFFACGRRYLPASNENGLFGVCQRTDVSVFVAAASDEQMWLEFDKLLTCIIELYERFGMAFRVCYARAASLKPAESCRATVQLYSRHENKFVDAARVSTFDTFVSQRLRILCHNAKRQHGLVRMVDGVVVSVPTLVACLLERSADRLHVPPCIRPFMSPR